MYRGYFQCDPTGKAIETLAKRKERESDHADESFLGRSVWKAVKTAVRLQAVWFVFSWWEAKHRFASGACFPSVRVRFPCVISTERSERRNLWYYSTRAVYSLFSNTICIRPSRKRGKDPFDSSPFLLGGSLRVTQRGGCAVSPLRLTQSVFCVISKRKRAEKSLEGHRADAIQHDRQNERFKDKFFW